MRARFLVLALGLIGCEVPLDDNDAPTGVDPSDSDDLSSVITIPGAVRVPGNPPSATGGNESPRVNGGGGLTVTPGGQTVIELTYESNTGYANCYVQVVGASEYFDVPVGESATSGAIQIPVNLAEGVEPGSFNLYSCIAGRNGQTSNPVISSVTVSEPEGSFEPGGSEPSGGAKSCNLVGQCTSGASLQACASDRGECWYEVGGQIFNCDGCECGDAANAAVRACP